MGEFEFPVLDRWDELSLAMEPARAHWGDGAGEAARDAVLAAFARLGIDAAGAVAGPVAGAPCWLIVCGRDDDRLLIAAAIPLDQIDDAVRTTLAECDELAVVFGETCYDAPDQWAAWARFVLGVGIRDAGDFQMDLDLQAQNGTGGPTRAELESWTGTWADRVACRSAGPANGSRLNVPLVGCTLIHENV